MKGVLMKRILVIILLAILLSGCKSKEDGPCPYTGILEDGTHIQTVLNLFAEKGHINSGMSDGQIKGIMKIQSGYLEQIRSMPVLDCMGKYKSLAMGSINSVLAAEQAMVDGNPYEVSSNYDDATDYLKKMTAEIKRLQKCAPDCE
jgi:hypothetical protein